MIALTTLEKAHRLKYKRDNAVRTVGATTGMLMAYQEMNPQLQLEISIGRSSVKVPVSTVVKVLETIRDDARVEVRTADEEIEALESEK